MTRLIKLGSVFLLILSLFFAVKIVTELREGKTIGTNVEQLATITISGEGEVFAVPDVTTFSFSVVEEADTPEGAQEGAAKRMNAALALLEDGGVPERDVKTTGYSLNPRHEWQTRSNVRCVEEFCPPVDRERVLVGYEVRQHMTVKVREGSDASSFLVALGDVGVNNISSLNFTIDDDAVFQDEARAKAIADAKAKAKILAKDLNVSLVRLVSFSESGGSAPQPFFARTVVDNFDFVDEEAVAPNLSVGENSIRSNVTLVYEIR